MYDGLYFFIVCFFFFKQNTSYELRISDLSSDVCSSDLHQIVRPRTQPRGKFPVDGQRVGISHGGCNRIAPVDEGEQRLDLVIAVGPPRPHVERQIDLRPAGLAHRRPPLPGATVAGVSPSRSLLSIRVAMSASAYSTAARQP